MTRSHVLRGFRLRTLKTARLVCDTTKRPSQHLHASVRTQVLEHAFRKRRQSVGQQTPVDSDKTGEHKLHWQRRNI